MSEVKMKFKLLGMIDLLDSAATHSMERGPPHPASQAGSCAPDGAAAWRDHSYLGASGAAGGASLSRRGSDDGSAGCAGPFQFLQRSHSAILNNLDASSGAGAQRLVAVPHWQS